MSSDEGGQEDGAGSDEQDLKRDVQDAGSDAPQYDDEWFDDGGFEHQREPPQDMQEDLAPHPRHHRLPDWVLQDVQNDLEQEDNSDNELIYNNDSFDQASDSSSEDGEDEVGEENAGRNEGAEALQGIYAFRKHSALC
jgi:hypothetical protein